MHDDLNVSVLAKDGGETQYEELRLCYTPLTEYKSDCAVHRCFKSWGMKYCVLLGGLLEVLRIGGAIRRVAAANEYPLYSGGRTRIYHRVLGRHMPPGAWVPGQHIITFAVIKRA